MAGELCSSYKDAPLSFSLLIYWVSYSLNLSSDAKKCPFGERKGKALVQIGRSTNSVPQAQAGNGWGVQFWSQKFAQILFHHYSSLPLDWYSALSLLGLICQNTGGKKPESFTFFWRLKIFRQDSGKHPSSPITQIRLLAFLIFFPSFLVAS